MGVVKTEYGLCYTADTCFYQYSDFEDCGLYVGDTGKIFISQAKKIKNVYHLIYECSNLIRAQYKAQQGKGERTEITKFNENILENLDGLYWDLRNETYTPGEYRIKVIYEPKERVIMIAPFFPDRIVHHCIINVLGRYWTNFFIANTYACIKGRGIHKCMEDVHTALIIDRMGTRFCLKIDIKKFYDNIDHVALKKIIRYTIADEQLLRLLDKIIYSNGKDKGLPIGNFTSQYFANLYLAYFDHWVKKELAKIVMKRFGVKIYYYRYMDDMVILCADKEALHFVLDMMGLYLGGELKVEIKSNWQIFPVDARSIDYVGFKQNHYGILLRSGILKRFYKKFHRTINKYEIKDETELNTSSRLNMAG
jgi:retron-type reverse transcriptase